MPGMSSLGGVVQSVGGLVKDSLNPVATISKLFGGGEPKQWQLTDLGKQQGYSIHGKAIYRPGSHGTKTINLPQQRGLLDIYEKDVYPALSRIEAQNADYRRQADLAAIQRYGQQYTNALLSANPQQKALLDEMNRQAMEGLLARQSLTPQETRSAQQASRAAFSARGLGLGNQSILDEMVRNSNLGQQREAQRRAFAQNVFGMNQSAAGDPFLQILGRPSQTLPYGQGMGAQGMAGISNLGATLFNPESQYAADIYNQGWQNLQAVRAANQANRTALIGAGIQAAGSLLGGGMSMLGGMCWVAREAFGVDDPRWLQFRAWMYQDSPQWFFDLYKRHGEAFARWMHDKPLVKRIVRRLMEGVL